MIYEEPRFLPGGDRYMLIEFGNEMNLELNFMAQGLAGAIEKSRTKGVIETAPCFASMLVHYDPDSDQFRGPGEGDDVADRLASVRPTISSSTAGCSTSRPSISIPGPRRRSTTTRAKIKEELGSGVRRRAQRPEGRAAVRASAFGHRILGRVAGLLAGPALHDGARPALRDHGAEIQSAAHLDAAGHIGMGGVSTAIYPVATPGGYQIFARIPVRSGTPRSASRSSSESICCSSRATA